MRQKKFKNLFVIIGMLLMLIPVEALGESSLNAMPNGVDSTGISDMQKATSFIKRLGPNAKVLLKLPAKAPHCVFYKENRFVKCYNIETDSVTNIVFPDIERTSIAYILPGVSNITVMSKTQSIFDAPYLTRYDIASKKFYKISLDSIYFEVVYKPVVSYANKTITFTYGAGRDGDTGPYQDVAAIIGDDASLEEWNAYMKKIVWHIVTKVFSFDGDLISDVEKPETWGTYMQRLRKEYRKKR